MLFYEPTESMLAELSTPWIGAYSGGKDSTSMVTWIEYLRRGDFLHVTKPRLVQTDTGVEFPFIQEKVEQVRTLLTKSGWECQVVMPETREKLLCQVFGRGLPPIHPGMTKGRWCTRSTKVDPMKRFRATLTTSNAGQNPKFLTGVRWGESKNRDSKLTVAGCSAGGECGTQISGENIYSPIINWTTCHIFDWLNGLVGRNVVGLIGDIFEITKALARIYSPEDFDGESLRFGCVACPALSRDKVLDNAASHDPRYVSLQAIYCIWKALYLPENRLCGVRFKKKTGKYKFVLGPIRMEARKRFFGMLMEIQRQSGVELVTQSDEKYIRSCWEHEVYPRGWTIDDERATPKLLDQYQSPLFHGRIPLELSNG